MVIPLWFRIYWKFFLYDFSKENLKIIQKKFFFPYVTGEALAFLPWKCVFFSCFFFNKKCHSTCAFESFSSIFSLHLWKHVTTLVILKGSTHCFLPHIHRKWKQRSFLYFHRQKVSFSLCFSCIFSLQIQVISLWFWFNFRWFHFDHQKVSFPLCIQCSFPYFLENIRFSFVL